MIVFGPIPSRRLGLSLGINNIGSQKLCSYSCVYCQIGETKQKTSLPQTCHDPEMLAAAVEKHLNKLDARHKPDYLTLVAKGEPTLDINIGKEIRLLKLSGFPVAVITNASVLNNNKVRESLYLADWVSVKIDSVDAKIWQRINRPARPLNLNSILAGISEFADGFANQLHTETMLLDGYNDTPEQLERTAAFISGLNPRKAYLSVPTRPCAVKGTKPVSESKLTEAWYLYISKGINTELLNGFEGTDSGFTGNAYEDILSITAVHPLREDQLTELLNREKSDFSVVQSLLRQRLLKKVNYRKNIFYARIYR